MRKWFKRLAPLAVAGLIAGGFAVIGGAASATPYTWSLDGGTSHNVVTATNGSVTVEYTSDYQGIISDLVDNKSSSSTFDCDNHYGSQFDAEKGDGNRHFE